MFLTIHIGAHGDKHLVRQSPHKGACSHVRPSSFEQLLFFNIKPALDYYEQQGKRYDAVMLLQNTSPFRTEEHVKEALKLFTPEVDMVVSVKECAANPYYCVFEEDGEGYLHVCKGDGNIFRRQDAPKVYEYNGAIYIMNVEKLKTTHMHKMQKRAKYVMDETSSLDLDTMWDWQMAEMMAKKN